MQSDGAVQQAPPAPRSGLITMYADDPIACRFGFGEGAYGSVIEDHMLKNRASDMAFDGYNPGEFTVGIEGGRKGTIVDLGTLDSLRAKYGYEETGAPGQGFASIRRQGGKFLILKNYAQQTTQELAEARVLMDAPNHAPIVDDHIYLVRLTDLHDRAFERVVKFMVVTYQPGESVTIRWQVID
jgi:hypothetical protein